MIIILNIEMNTQNTQNHKKYDYMSKMVIVGDSAVGKTNILLRFT